VAAERAAGVDVNATLVERMLEGYRTASVCSSVAEVPVAYNKTSRCPIPLNKNFSTVVLWMVL